MANWNFISKLMSTIGTTAFGVGLCGKFTQKQNFNCYKNSVFSGYFGSNNNYNPYNFNLLNNTMFPNNIKNNPYAFLNTNITPTSYVSGIASPTQVSRTQAPPPTRSRRLI